jgi:hypothetical protein
MGSDGSIKREKPPAREVQILDHLEQAPSLDAHLTEYAAAYNLDVKDLYAGKAQLVKKRSLPGRAPRLGRAATAASCTKTTRSRVRTGTQRAPSATRGPAEPPFQRSLGTKMARHVKRSNATFPPKCASRLLLPP